MAVSLELDENKKFWSDLYNGLESYHWQRLCGELILCGGRGMGTILPVIIPFRAMLRSLNLKTKYR
jgi:hypothetical protein